MKRFIRTVFFLCILTLAIASPALAAEAAAKSGGFVGLLERLAPYAEAMVLLLGMVAYYLKSEKEKRTQALVALVPDAHDLAQKIIDKRKADGKNVDAVQTFIGVLRDLAKGFGYDVMEKERVAMAALGSAEHQRFKMIRGVADGGNLYVEADELPAEISADPLPEPGVS